MLQPLHPTQASSRSSAPGAAKRAPRPRNVRVTRLLWGGLALSIALTIAVRIHVGREEARWSRALDSVGAGLTSPTAVEEQGSAASDIRMIGTESPAGPVAANALRLSWDDVPAAAEFRLQVSTVAGDVVVDRLAVPDPAWTPPFEVLPALRPGEYVWNVEAVDPEGTTLARSLPQRFRIAR